MLAPAQKGRACAGTLLGQFNGQQTEGIASRLRQHAPLRQVNQLIPERVTPVDPVFEIPFTLKSP